MTDRLRGSGYDVVQAWDGPGAVDRCREARPDLPDDLAACALGGRDAGDDDWLEWNLGRHRAAPLRSPLTFPPRQAEECPGR